MTNTTPEERALSFTWDCTHADHVESIAYVIARTHRTKFARSQHRKSGIMGWLIVIPLGLFGVLVTGIPIGLTIAALYVLILLIPVLGRRWLTGSTTPQKNIKLAERLIESSDDPVPLGTHTLTVCDGLLDWYWIDGRQRITYPARDITECEESGGRLYLLRGNTVRGSLPLTAFPSQADRALLEVYLEAARLHDYTPAHPPTEPVSCPT